MQENMAVLFTTLWELCSYLTHTYVIIDNKTEKLHTFIDRFSSLKIISTQRKFYESLTSGVWCRNSFPVNPLSRQIINH